MSLKIRIFFIIIIAFFLLLPFYFSFIYASPETMGIHPPTVDVAYYGEVCLMTNSPSTNFEPYSYCKKYRIREMKDWADRPNIKNFLYREIIKNENRAYNRGEYL